MCSLLAANKKSPGSLRRRATNCHDISWRGRRNLGAAAGLYDTESRRRITRYAVGSTRVPGRIRHHHHGISHVRVLRGVSRRFIVDPKNRAAGRPHPRVRGPGCSGFSDRVDTRGIFASSNVVNFALDQLILFRRTLYRGGKLAKRSGR